MLILPFLSCVVLEVPVSSVNYESEISGINFRKVGNTAVSFIEFITPTWKLPLIKKKKLVHKCYLEIIKWIILGSKWIANVEL